MASEKKRAIYYFYWYKYEVNFFSDLPLMTFSKCFWRHAFVSDQLEPIKNVVTVNSFRTSLRSGKHILRICRKLNVYNMYTRVSKPYAHDWINCMLYWNIYPYTSLWLYRASLSWLRADKALAIINAHTRKRGSLCRSVSLMI